MSKHEPRTYSIRLVEGLDQGIAATTARDVFEILGDGQPVFRITYDYWADGDTSKQSMLVESLTKDLAPSDLPFICNGINLGAKLLSWLDRELSENDCEFYADLFRDEDGEPVMFSINKLIFGGN